MKKLLTIACALCAFLAFDALAADPTPIGTLVLEENFSDYAKITNGVVTIQGTSITPLTTHITNAGLNNSLSNDTSAKTATVKINNVSATVYSSDGVTVENNTSAGTSVVTVGANSTTVYTKAKTDTLLSGKAGTATTLAGYNIGDAKIEDVTGGKKITLGSAYVTLYEWAFGSAKPAYMFAEIGSTPTTLAGYGITDAKTLQTAVTSPTASGNATAFIDTISQDTNGKITVTKKNVNFGSYVPTSRTINSKQLNANVTLYGSDIAMSSSDSTKLNTAVAAKVSLANVKIDGAAMTSSTIVELGNCYIKYTTTGGKTTAALFAR